MTISSDNHIGGTGVLLPSSREQLFALLEYADSRARADLARKVLETVSSAINDYCNCGAIRGASTHRGSCRAASADLARARLHDLFKQEGIERESKL